MKQRWGLLLALALVALPLTAQSNDIGLWIAMSQVGDTRSEEATINFDDGEGFGASYNHFWGNSLSTEISATALSHDGRIKLSGVTFTDLGSLDIVPVVATAQWHFARRGRVSPYVGAGVAYVMADDLESENLDAIGVGKVEVESQVTWAAQAGLNIALGSRFAIGIDAKYIPYTPDAAPPGDPDKLELDLNPVIFSAGFKLRW